MLWKVAIVNRMVVEGFGNGDLPTGYYERATFDLHFQTTFVLLT